MLPVLSLLTLAIPLVAADVDFTTPGPGVEVPYGEINVAWKQNGKAPFLADLTQYTLNLMTGGNEEDNMLPIATFVSAGDYATGNLASGVVSSGIAATVKNGFFFQMVSAAAVGGIVINYSDRFTITNLTGSTPPIYRDAAAALSDTIAGPPRVNNVVGFTSSSSQPGATTTVATNTSNNQSPKTVTVTSPHVASSSAAVGHEVPTGGNGAVRLSAGATAGVVVAVILCMTTAVAIAFSILRRRRQRQRSPAEMHDKFGSPEMKNSHASISTLSELTGESQRAEAGDGQRPPEMDSTNIRAELAGDFTQEPQEADSTPVLPRTETFPEKDPSHPLHPAPPNYEEGSGADWTQILQLVSRRNQPEGRDSPMSPPTTAHSRQNTVRSPVTPLSARTPSDEAMERPVTPFSRI